MKYFNNITTLDELKAQYRRLAMQYHPDCGGDTEIMKAINNEHDELFEILKANQNAADPEHATTETPEEFRDIIAALLKLHGLTIELCGRWLWISGDTKSNKDELKSAGCKWSSSKKMWYWHHVEDGAKFHKGRNYSINDIRTKYGSQTFENGNESSGYNRIGATA